MEEFAGSLRITNPITLQKWKDNGEYDKLIELGYNYYPGCGRFRIFICHCTKCRKYRVNEIIQNL